MAEAAKPVQKLPVANEGDEGVSATANQKSDTRHQKSNYAPFFLLTFQITNNPASTIGIDRICPMLMGRGL